MALGPGTSEITPSIVDPPRLPVRVETVRRQFDARVARWPRHEAVVREVGRRLIERLDLMRLAPRLVADVGAGGGAARTALMGKFPQSRWLGLDLSAAMLASGRKAGWSGRLAAWAGSSPWLVCAEAGQLPLPAGAVDLVHSNLMLHWHPAPHTLFVEWARVLGTDGLLLFSAFGPDTLKELRAAMTEAWPAARPVSFVDMHDYGDMMVAAGLATPVMDVETLTLTYASAAALISEARALGANPRDDRPDWLPGGAAGRRLREALTRRAGPDGRIALSFEVVYGHAWKPAPRVRGQTAVTLEALRAELGARKKAPS
jgi:malonyl-CoA O-methyltransferase